MSDIILSAHQVNFLPYLGFFEKIVHSDVFILLDDVQFVHTGDLAWMNRNKIRTKQGWQYITIPVYIKGRFGQLLQDVEINYEHDWKRKILGSIKQNYCHASFFNPVFSKLDEIINRNYSKLIELNYELLKFVLEYLELSPKMVFSSQLNIKSRATQRLIDLCNIFNARKYLSGVHGKDYLDIELFKKHGIEVIFQDFKPKEYVQQFDGFVPNLSVIDALFNLGRKTLHLL